MKRAVDALFNGVFFALGMWGMLTLFGIPAHSFWDHHLTEALAWSGWIVAWTTFFRGRKRSR